MQDDPQQRRCGPFTDKPSDEPGPSAALTEGAPVVVQVGDEPVGEVEDPASRSAGFGLEGAKRLAVRGSECVAGDAGAEPDDDRSVSSRTAPAPSSTCGCAPVQRPSTALIASIGGPGAKPPQAPTAAPTGATASCHTHHGDPLRPPQRPGRAGHAQPVMSRCRRRSAGGQGDRPLPAPDRCTAAGAAAPRSSGSRPRRDARGQAVVVDRSRVRPVDGPRAATRGLGAPQTVAIPG